MTVSTGRHGTGRYGKTVVEMVPRCPVPSRQFHLPLPRTVPFRQETPPKKLSGCLFPSRLLLFPTAREAFRVKPTVGVALFGPKVSDQLSALREELLRGGTVNRAYGTHKNLYVSLFLITMFWSCLPWPPVIPVRMENALVCSF